MFHRITGFDILTDLGLDGRGRFVMNTTSRAPRRCSSRFGMVLVTPCFPALSFLMRYSSTQAVASGGYNPSGSASAAGLRCKKFIKQRNRVIRDGGEHGVGQHSFALPVRCGHGIQQNVTSCVH